MALFVEIRFGRGYTRLVRCRTCCWWTILRRSTVIMEGELWILSSCRSWYCIRPDANEPLVLLPGRQLIPSDPHYKEGSADLSPMLHERVYVSAVRHLGDHTPSTQPAWRRTSTAVLDVKSECQAKSQKGQVIYACLYRCAVQFVWS